MKINKKILIIPMLLIFFISNVIASDWDYTGTSINILVDSANMYNTIPNGNYNLVFGISGSNERFYNWSKNYDTYYNLININPNGSTTIIGVGYDVDTEYIYAFDNTKRQIFEYDSSLQLTGNYWNLNFSLYGDSITSIIKKDGFFYLGNSYLGRIDKASDSNINLIVSDFYDTNNSASFVESVIYDTALQKLFVHERNQTSGGSKRILTYLDETTMSPTGEYYDNPNDWVNMFGLTTDITEGYRYLLSNPQTIYKLEYLSSGNTPTFDFSVLSGVGDLNTVTGQEYLNLKTSGDNFGAVYLKASSISRTPNEINVLCDVNNKYVLNDTFNYENPYTNGGWNNGVQGAYDTGFTSSSTVKYLHLYNATDTETIFHNFSEEINGDFEFYYEFMPIANSNTTGSNVSQYISFDLQTIDGLNSLIPLRFYYDYDNENICWYYYDIANATPIKDKCTNSGTYVSSGSPENIGFIEVEGFADYSEKTYSLKISDSSGNEYYTDNHYFYSTSNYDVGRLVISPINADSWSYVSNVEVESINDYPSYVSWSLDYWTGYCSYIRGSGLYKSCLYVQDEGENNIYNNQECVLINYNREGGSQGESVADGILSSLLPDKDSISNGQKYLYMLLILIVTSVIFIFGNVSTTNDGGAKIWLYIGSAVVILELFYFIAIGYLPVIIAIILGLITGFIAYSTMSRRGV